ncbi:MAG TPA: YisL family protein [Candidatus Salinicoccus stercoripullorum]|uniref:YisL family protein n=1 Tax=Candidatus Salinicoccus stercoripullorum TaxID=2838756 RepID=A0A9D1QG32_9STAP|nr:YisL family protein [Candidatus Salinicoccus stercoripullorum]
MIHLHLTAIVIAVVFFFITYFSIKNPGDPDAKYAKAPHMVARLFYVIVLVSGLVVFIQAMGINGMLYGLKFLAGLFTIGLMEMAVIRKRKGTGQTLFTIFLVLAVITIGLGIYLPMGPLTALFR